MQINDTNHLNHIIKGAGKQIEDKSLIKLGESQINFIIKLFKKIFLPKKDLQQFFLLRGISVIKEKNLNFIKEKLLINDPTKIIQLIPKNFELIKAEPSEILKLHTYLNLENQYANLKNQIEKQKQEILGHHHWINHFGSEGLTNDPTTLETISRLNNLYLENENWLTHEDFATAIGKNLDQLKPTNDPINPSKYDLVAKTLRLLAHEPNKRSLFNAVFNAEETRTSAIMSFYIQNPSFFNSSEDLSKAIVNLNEWQKFLILKKDGIEGRKIEVNAFVSEMGTYLLDSSPSLSSPQTKDIKQLFGFYLDIMRVEKLKPDILAKALNSFMETQDFHTGVYALGASYSKIFNNAAENKLLALYKTIEHEEAQPKNLKIPLAGFEKTLGSDPFSIVKTLLPNFIAQVAGNPKVKGNLDEALELIGPFANEMILSNDVKAYLKKNEGKLDDKFDTVKSLLTSIDTTDIKVLIQLVKSMVKRSFAKGVGQKLANIFVDANKLHIEGKKKDLSPIQTWLLNDLPKLAQQTSLLTFGLNTLLNSGFGRWIGETIGGSIIKSNFIKFIDTSPLTDEQKKYWKNNKQLMEGINKLVNVILPIFPKIVQNHDLDFYSQALKNINSLIQSPKPVDQKKVVEELSQIVNHFLDQDLPNYEGPVLNVLGKINDIG